MRMGADIGHPIGRHEERPVMSDELGAAIMHDFWLT